MSEEAAVSASEFARLIGCRPSYVTALKAAGRLVLDDAGKIIVEASKARIAQTRDPAKRAVADRHAEARGADLFTAVEQDDATDDLGSYQEARTLREQYLAKAAKRDYEVSIGKLLDAAAVTAAAASAVTQFRTRLEGRAPVLASQLATVRDEAEAARVIAESDEHLLGELARQFSALAKPKP